MIVRASVSLSPSVPVILPLGHVRFTTGYQVIVSLLYVVHIFFYLLYYSSSSSFCPPSAAGGQR
jgi:hypothetical protein